MGLEQKLEEALTEIREISRLDSALYTGQGRLIAATFQTEEMLEERVRSFMEFSAEASTAEGFHFFRFRVEQTGEEYVLLVQAAVEEAYMVGRLAVCQLRNLIGTNTRLWNKNSFLRELILGNLPGEEIFDRARKLHFSASEWVVYVLKTHGRREEACVETMKNLFSDREKDFLIEVDEQFMILIKDAKGLDADKLEELAWMMSDNLQTEAMQQISVAYGKRAEQIGEIETSYQEARMALEIGDTFYSQNRVFSYRELSVGKIIYQMPVERCEELVSEVFGGKEETLDEEDLKTVQRFFDNDLNISETARQMYVHRNTLVYRLERIEKAVGLDVRKFEDAMKFRLALMGRTRLEQRKS